MSLYKDAIKSYSWDEHYLKDKPLEQGFDRWLMTDRTSSLYDDISSLFLELRLSQAQRYIAAWENAYIITGWCADNDKPSFDRLQAIGHTFIEVCKKIAAEVCENDTHPQGQQPQGGGGTYHQNKVQQNKTQTEIQGFLLPDKLNTYKARKTYIKAKNKGLIEVSDKGLKWSESNALLAFLCGIVYCGDTQYQDAVTKEWMVKRGSEFFPNKELNTLFGVMNLGQSRTQLNRLPKGNEKVLELVKGS